MLSGRLLRIRRFRRRLRGARRDPCRRGRISLLQRGDHFLDLRMLHARTEDLETSLFRAPLQNVDIDIARAPAFHLQLGRLIEVDCAGTDQGRSVIVNDIFLSRADDLEASSERETRPIGGRAHDVMSGQVLAEGVLVSAFFQARISRRANVRHAAEMRVCGFDGSDWLVNN